MKVLVIICILVLAVPVPVSANNIKTQETREMRFVLADSVSGSKAVTIKLSDGSAVVLNELNGWEDRRMVLGSVSVKKVEGGEVDSSSTVDEVRIRVQAQQPATVKHTRPKFEEVKINGKRIWAVGGLLCAGALFLIMAVKRK